MSQKPDKNTPQALQGKVNSAATNVFLMVFFTVINLVLLLTDSGKYFLFSASVPYWLTFDGAVMDIVETGEMFGTYTMTALAISAAVLGFYVLCVFLAKKNSLWFAVAAVVFAIDTVLLLYWNDFDLEDIILDVVFHAWVLYSLISGLLAANKLKQLQQEVNTGSPELQ